MLLWAASALLAQQPALESKQRVPSPDKKHFVVCERYAQHSEPGSLVPPFVYRLRLFDTSGKLLLTDDYRDRDYQPEAGHWSASGRFYVFPIHSYGGHSPWHWPFVVIDTQRRRTYTDDDLGSTSAVSTFHLSGDDTISYKRLDPSNDNWDNGVPGLSRRFSLASGISRLKPTK